LIPSRSPAIAPSPPPDFAAIPAIPAIIASAEEDCWSGGISCAVDV